MRVKKYENADKIENITITKKAEQISIPVWEINEINLIFTQYGTGKQTQKIVTIKLIVFNFIVKADGLLNLNAEIYAD